MVTGPGFDRAEERQPAISPDACATSSLPPEIHHSEGWGPRGLCYHAVVTQLCQRDADSVASMGQSFHIPSTGVQTAPSIWDQDSLGTWQDKWCRRCVLTPNREPGCPLGLTFSAC